MPPECVRKEPPEKKTLGRVSHWCSWFVVVDLAGREKPNLASWRRQRRPGHVALSHFPWSSAGSLSFGGLPPSFLPPRRPCPRPPSPRPSSLILVLVLGFPPTKSGETRHASGTPSYLSGGFHDVTLNAAEDGRVNNHVACARSVMGRFPAPEPCCAFSLRNTRGTHGARTVHARGTYGARDGAQMHPARASTT